MPELAFDYELFKKTFTQEFGKEALEDLNAQPTKGSPGTFIPTPSESLNRALGIGGLPRGRIVECFGMESSGKSTLALDFLKSAQIMFPDKPVAYVDSEQAVNIEYAQAIGIDTSPDKFLFSQETETERALGMVHTFAKAGVSVVVMDSVASLISKKEMEEQETTESRMGGNAKALSSHLRFMVGTCNDTKTIALYINQIRYKIGVMFGNPETTPGGQALRYYSTVRLDTRIKEHIKDKDLNVTGVRIKVKVVKNKVAAPYRTAEFTLRFGKGIDRIGDLLDTCEEVGVVTKAGGHYKLDGQALGNGRDNVILAIYEDPELQKQLTERLWAAP